MKQSADIEKNYHFSNTFWLYQHPVKYAPLQFCSNFFLTFFKQNTLYSTFLLINDQNTKWGAATLVTNATIWSFHSMYHYIVIYYRWLHSILRLSPSVRFCVHLMAAIMAKHKSCQIDIGRSKTRWTAVLAANTSIAYSTICRVGYNGKSNGNVSTEDIMGEPKFESFSFKKPL